MNAATSPAETRSSFVAWTACILAFGWLASRVVLGLDLTDEMQYYGEIASLARHGRLFHDDLFIQQLGYVPLAPLFALHARIFPDQSFLLLFGRLLLLATYGAVAWHLWRVARGLGFSQTARLAALATFFAWIPFQIFAFGYNSLAYLLIVAFAGLWLRQPAGDNWRGDLPLTLTLIALGLAYPPAGIALTALAIVGTALRRDRRAAVRLFGHIALNALVSALVILAWQGQELFANAVAAVKFSRAFGVAEVILWPSHLGGWVVLTLGCGILIWRQHRAPPPSPATVRSLTMLGSAGLILLAAMSPRAAIGYFATAVFVLLLVLLRSTRETDARVRIVDLAIGGVVLGTVFAFTSGNGLHNFGLGAIGFAPWLVLHASRALAESAPRLAAILLPPACGVLLLVNGVCHPYREQAVWHPFVPVTDVPAFRGLRTSAVKVEAIATLRRFTAAAQLDRTRLLVAGPHAWIYFAARAEPVTPMFFLHFSGKPAAYDIVAARLFLHGEPDAVLVTNGTPAILHTRITEWARPGVTAQMLALPPDFIQRYRRQTDYDFAPEMVLLRRTPPKP